MTSLDTATIGRRHLSFEIMGRGVGLLKHLAVLAALILLWEGAAAFGLIDTVLLPTPSQIGAGIVELYVTNRQIYRHFLITFYEAFAGFLIGAAFGLLIAVGSTLSRRFRRYVSPYAVVLNVTPGLALTPIVIAWFGFGYSSKIALGAIVSFFPIFVNALIGLTRVDADTDEMFRSLRASPFDRFWKLQVPAALPLIFAGFKIAITTSLVGAVVSEFSQGTAGIGVLMQRLAFSLDMGSAIAALLSMSLLGLLLFVIVEILDARVVFWRREARRTAVSRAREARWAHLTGQERSIREQTTREEHA